MQRHAKTSRTQVAKSTFRSKRSKLKRKIRNTRLCSWEVTEQAQEKLRLIKFPKHRVTRANDFVSAKRVQIKAPRIIDYYSRYTFEETNKFIQGVVSCVRDSKRRVFIDFSNTEKISAAAMLSLLAEVDILTKLSSHGKWAISFGHPKESKVESILKQVGFYDIVGKEKRETIDYDDVTFWKYCSGKCSEPLIAKPILEEIKNELEKRASKKLYRGFVEAMSNSVEHAYLEDPLHCEENNTAKWWTFAGIKDRKLTVVICDKGVGIPATLPKTQGVSKLNDILTSLGYKTHKITDGKYIRAATSLRRTRTGSKNRGKGLSDIKAVIDTIGKGSLLIFSNKGGYRYKAQKIVDGGITDYKTSVCGTIIEWTIPLD
ncbi:MULTISPECIES: ATP-binding protein [Vibrio]|uniref:ATP-binding protein n=1 Tax=Vibrio TaxID=662 RepID=UPI0002D6AB95|nr:ATP-binding protein [Vibrio tasmaniensis]OEF86831.1 hypothetical protein A162_23960 [Vibrio tasmaniensis 1F-155]